MNTTIAKTENEPNPFQKYGNEKASFGHITGKLLRFSKMGKWLAGQEQEELPDGTRMLAYVPGLKVGWVRWNDGAPAEHRMGIVADGFEPEDRSELGDTDQSEWPELGGRRIDPWQETNYLVLLDESGELYTYATSSKTGLSAVGALSKAYGDRIRMKPDEIPIIELRSRAWTHRDFGEQVAPVLKITGAWSKIPQNFTELANALDSEAVEDKTVTFGGVKQLTAPKPVRAQPKATAKQAVPPGRSKAKNGPGKTVRF
jgi:hypothetical protein